MGSTADCSHITGVPSRAFKEVLCGLQVRGLFLPSHRPREQGVAGSPREEGISGYRRACTVKAEQTRLVLPLEEAAAWL